MRTTSLRSLFKPTTLFSMSYIAPEDNYEGPVKGHIRITNIDLFVEHALDGCLRNKHEYVAILPSNNGLEVVGLLQRGFPQKQIVVLDKSPDVVHQSWWSYAFPDLVKVVGNLSEGISAANLGGSHRVVSAVNADLCSNYQEPYRKAISGFLEKTPMKKGALFITTMTRAREKDLDRIKEVAKDSMVNFGHKFSDIRTAAAYKEIPILKTMTKSIISETKYKGSKMGTPMVSIASVFR